MMNVLLKNQRRMIMNTIRTQSGKNLFSYGIVAVLVVVFLYWISRGIWVMSDLLTPAIFTGILSYGSLIAMAMIILLSLPQVFKHLYAATDLHLLFTMPIPTRHIFWIKYIQSFAGVPLFICIFFTIPLFVYGFATSVHLLYYPVVILMVLAVTNFGLSLAYLINLVIIQIIPASRANEFMMAMSFLSGIIMYLMYFLPTMVNDEPISELLLAGLPLFPKWVPVHWVGTAIVEAANGSSGFFLPCILFILLVAVLALLATSLVEKGFRTGWIRLSEGGKKKKKKRSKTARVRLTHPILAVGKKEWFSVKRDLREWFVLMPIFFIFIFGGIGFFTNDIDVDLTVVRSFNEFSWPIAQGILLFAYALSNGTIAASSIGREGASAWILRVIPVSGTHIALGKVWISWLIPFIILTALELVAGIILGWTIGQFMLGIVLKIVITSGISAIGLWLGTTGAKYNPTNPQQRLKFVTSFLLLIASYVYLVISVIPFVWLILPAVVVPDLMTFVNNTSGFMSSFISIFASLLEWKGNAPFLGVLSGIAATVVFSGGIFYLFIRASAAQLNKGIKIDMVSDTSSRKMLK